MQNVLSLCMGEKGFLCLTDPPSFSDLQLRNFAHLNNEICSLGEIDFILPQGKCKFTIEWYVVCY